MFRFSWLCGLACLLASGGRNDLLLVAADPPNVLLICVDDLKPTIGCYGDPVAVTPQIDRLARRGVRFDAAYCNQAVCSPSRNSLMTGLRPQTIGVYDLPTHFRLAVPDAVTFSQHFVNQGYRAEGLGKIYHVGHGNIDDRASWSVPLWRPKGSAYALPASLKNMIVDSQGRKRGPATEAAAVEDTVYGDGKIAVEAVKRLEAASKHPQQPFFLAVGFLKPHLPFVAPQKYWDLYDPQQLPMPSVTEPPAGAPRYAPSSGGELRNYSDIDKGPVDAETTRHLIHGYYAATSYMDAQLGVVLDAMDRLQLADNTIVILWGDHGWHLGDHGMWCKHTNYEQAARIPLIIAAPDAAAGRHTDALVETVDLYPTVAELAGVKAPLNLDGQSFAGAVRDPAAYQGSPSARQAVTHVYPRGGRLGRAIRNTRYRMVEWKAWNERDANRQDANQSADNQPVDIELYDYQLDPLETINIAAERPQVVAELRAELAKQPAAKPQWKPAAKLKQGARPGKPALDREAMFRRRDADQDGWLTLEEFLTSQPDPTAARGRFPKFDINNDGKLSAAEFVGKAR